jgi:hypothetical protein
LPPEDEPRPNASFARLAEVVQTKRFHLNIDRIAVALTNIDRRHAERERRRARRTAA